MTSSHPPPAQSRAKPVSPEDRKLILDLAPHYSIRAIAKRVLQSRKIVRRILVEAGIEPAPKSQGKLNEFLEPITVRVNQGLKVPRILREIRDLGYTGGRTILGDLVHRLRAKMPLTARKKIRRRFETRMGEEMQVDWSVYTVPIKEKPTRIHVLGILLANSRKVSYGVFRNEKQETLLEGLARGLEYFQGSALRLVFDNMATAVLGRIGKDRHPLWHPRLLEFSRHYGFTPFACAVRDPDRKGKKEKSFRLLFDDFIKGSSFQSWDELERRLHAWLDETPGVGNCRTHGTTGLIPNDVWLRERDLLVDLPEKRFMAGREVIRLVDADCTVSIEGCRYSVPAVLAGHQAPVRLYAGHFEVFNSHGTLLYSRAYIDRSTHPGKLAIEPTLYANLPRRPKEQVDGGRLDRDFLNRFPTLGPFVDGLKISMKSIVNIHLLKLLRLVDTYGQEAFLKEATIAQKHRRFDAFAVERLLEQNHPLPPEDLVAPLNGAGPAILGDAEKPSFDDYDWLDDVVDSDKEDDNGSK